MAAAHMYNNGKAMGRNWPYDDFAFMLVKSSYTFNPTDYAVSDIVAHEASGTGYSRLPVNSRSISVDNGTGIAYMRCASPEWPTVTVSDVKYLVLYQDLGSDAGNVLIACYPFDDAFSITATNLAPYLSGAGAPGAIGNAFTGI